ncbi:hypothetical protein KAI87_02665, partial [Myxococcota bacterium]|nr:hypothetical protein [Myxococcota bacterium]
VHYGCDYMNIENNIMFDSIVAGGVTDVRASSSYSMNGSTFKNNILYDLGAVNPDSNTLYANYLYWTNDTQVENNTYVDIASSYYHGFENTSGTMSWNNNLLINVVGGVSTNDGATVTGNYYYNTATQFLKTGTEFIDVAATDMTDYAFDYEIFTAAPKTKTLTGVSSTVTSPHYGAAGSSIE